MQDDINIFFDEDENLFYVTGRGFAIVAEPQNIIKEIKKLRYIYPGIDRIVRKIQKAHYS